MEEDKKYKDMTPEEKEKYLNRVKNIGAATTVTGLTVSGLSSIPKIERYRKFAEKKGYNRMLKDSGKVRKTGLAAATVGAGLYGVSKYKHRKLKKDEDSKKD